MKPIRIVLTPTRSRPLNILLGLVLMLVAVLLLMTLASYHPTDPSFNTSNGEAGTSVVRNWMGLSGSYSSDLIFQLLGISAFLLPIWLGNVGWNWFRSRGSGLVWLRWIGVLVALAFLPTFFGLFPWHLNWLHVLPIEGLVGNIVASLLIRGVGSVGAWVTSIILAAVGLYFGSVRNIWAVRLWIEHWSHRWENWRSGSSEEDLAVQHGEPDYSVVPTQAEAEFGEPRSNWLAQLFRRRKPNEEVADELDAAPALLPPGTEADAVNQSIWERSVADHEHAAPVATPAKLTAAEQERLAPAHTANVIPMPARPAAPIEQAPVTTERAPAAKAVPSTIAIHERADAVQSIAASGPATTVAKPAGGFQLPPISLLNAGSGPQAIREDQLRAEARTLIEKCAEFGVHGQVVQINPGPMVTTYEFKPEAGVKYSRVTGLADDLCLAMSAESILIERMAGKSTVGIQVPNQERETIHLRDVVESELFTKAKSKLTLAMGKDINGRIVTTDLAAMPHVLIAGSTGSGKSVAINAMIMSLLYRTTPSQVRLILVDPKRVELGMYEGVPHLFTPIITEAKLAANALRNAVREMERRLKLLASRGVRNIDQYNKLFEEDTPSLFERDVDEEPLPFIVIIIDELADLMMLDRANVEESITRLAQMARAVGIHLVLATQRPSVDVITGLIKANVPTRISFRLATKVDSRTILDNNGAEALLGRGDMLFMPPGTSRLMRLHAPYVSEKETAAVVNFWKAQGQAEYVQGFLEAPKEDRAAADSGDGDGDNDPLYDDAVRLVYEFSKASTSLLQRRLRVGYGRAAHLIDLMERDGLIGPADGSRPRELLKPPGWFDEVANKSE